MMLIGDDARQILNNTPVSPHKLRRTTTNHDRRDRLCCSLRWMTDGAQNCLIRLEKSYRGELRIKGDNVCCIQTQQSTSAHNIYRDMWGIFETMFLWREEAVLIVVEKQKNRPPIGNIL